jgi:transketolase
LIRPADANETAAAWKAAMMHKGGPVILAFTRQNVPVLEASGVQAGVAKGGYVLSDCAGRPDVLLMASGSEVQIILKAQQLLAQEGVNARVVSVPSMELFAAQGEAYIAQVLPPDVMARVAVEAGVKQGWQEYLKDGRFIGLDRFGASAPYQKIYQNLGITPEAVVQAAKAQLIAERQ